MVHAIFVAREGLSTATRSLSITAYAGHVRKTEHNVGSEGYIQTKVEE